MLDGAFCRTRKTKAWAKRYLCSSAPPNITATTTEPRMKCSRGVDWARAAPVWRAVASNNIETMECRPMRDSGIVLPACRGLIRRCDAIGLALIVLNLEALGNVNSKT